MAATLYPHRRQRELLELLGARWPPLIRARVGEHVPPHCGGRSAAADCANDPPGAKAATPPTRPLQAWSRTRVTRWQAHRPVLHPWSHGHARAGAVSLGMRGEQRGRRRGHHAAQAAAHLRLNPGGDRQGSDLRDAAARAHDPAFTLRVYAHTTRRSEEDREKARGARRRPPLGTHRAQTSESAAAVVERDADRDAETPVTAGASCYRGARI
jgi:hypothetical protein